MFAIIQIRYITCLSFFSYNLGDDCNESYQHIGSPALLQPCRVDRMIEFPLPNEEALNILKIHSRKMNLTRGFNLLSGSQGIYLLPFDWFFPLLLLPSPRSSCQLITISTCILYHCIPHLLSLLPHFFGRWFHTVDQRLIILSDTHFLPLLCAPAGNRSITK